MVTLGDVAAAAGTSTTTVSRVLNGCGDQYRISAKTQAEVLAAAEQLGYRPSYHARALKAGRSQTVGLMGNADMLSGHGRGFYGGMIDGINKVVRQSGYHLLLTSDEDRYLTLQQGVAFWKEQRVDALITFDFVIGRYIRTGTPLEIDIPDLPLVLLGNDWGLDYSAVEMTCARAMRDAVAHLAELGHRRIGWLAQGEQGGERAAAVAAAADEHGLDLAAVALEPVKLPPPHEQWQAIAAQAERIDQVWDRLADRSAMLCFNDQLALALQLAARRRGRNVPDELSIIGFDDLYAQTALPALSTVSHNLMEMGREAGRIALEMAASPEAVAAWHARRVAVEATFIPRASTAAPAADRA